jgi:ADP-ribose pyrophosphatase YjhB (NUDIX family)
MPRPDLFDLMALLGLILLTAGVGMWSVPGGFVAAGVVLLTIGVLGSGRGA